MIFDNNISLYQFHVQNQCESFLMKMIKIKQHSTYFLEFITDIVK